MAGYEGREAGYGGREIGVLEVLDIILTSKSSRSKCPEEETI